MSAGLVLVIYLVFFGIEFLFETILEFLNIKKVKKESKTVPEFFSSFVNFDQYSKACKYTIEKNRFSIISSFFGSIFLLVIILSRSLGLIDNFVSTISSSIYLQGILYIFIISFIFKIFSMPFSIYSQFVIEEKYGFNKMTTKLYIVDLLKGIIVSVLLMTPLLLALFWFMNATGDFWYLFAFLFITVFQLLLTVLYPVLIAPLFNKFNPLPEGTLKEKLKELAEKLSFKTQGIFLMDGSKRSSHSNAYFTGLGRKKRIVLFDTLLETLKEEELVSVLAHEIGHEKKKHILKHLVISSIFLFLMLFVINFFLDYSPLFNAFGINEASYHGILIIISFCSGPFTFFLNPLVTMWSRKHEYEADKYAIEAVGTFEHLKNALINLSKENLSNLTPHPLYSFYHYSHPTLYERIKAMEKTNKN